MNVSIIKKTRIKLNSLLYLPFGHDCSVSGQYLLSSMYYGNSAVKGFTYSTLITLPFLLLPEMLLLSYSPFNTVSKETSKCLCGSLNGKCLPQAAVLALLVTSCLYCLKRFGWCSLAGGSAALMADIESLKPHTSSSSLFLLSA